MKKPIVRFISKSAVGALTALIAASASPSQAGERVGNGGVGVVCRDPRGNILSAEMLDVFEGKNQFGLKYEGSPSLDVDTMVNLAQLTMTANQKFLLDFQSELPKVRSKITFLARGVGLEPTNDAFPVINKKGCEFEQVANYTGDGNIYVDKEIFDRFDKVNQAALYVHETVYAVARTNVGETDSIRSRKVTAHVLAKTPDSGVIRKLMTALTTRPAPPAPVMPAERIRYVSAKGVYDWSGHMRHSDQAFRASLTVPEKIAREKLQSECPYDLGTLRNIRYREIESRSGPSSNPTIEGGWAYIRSVEGTAECVLR